jgi:hypothetical protein
MIRTHDDGVGCDANPSIFCPNIPCTLQRGGNKIDFRAQSNDSELLWFSSVPPSHCYEVFLRVSPFSASYLRATAAAYSQVPSELCKCQLAPTRTSVFSCTSLLTQQLAGLQVRTFTFFATFLKIRLTSSRV